MMVGGRSTPLGSEWVASLWGYFLGTSVAITSLYMGQQAALLLHIMHTSRSTLPTSSDKPLTNPIINGQPAGDVGLVDRVSLGPGNGAHTAAAAENSSRLEYAGPGCQVRWMALAGRQWGRICSLLMPVTCGADGPVPALCVVYVLMPVMRRILDSLEQSPWEGREVGMRA